VISSVLAILGGIATIVGGIIAYKNSSNRQRRAAEKDIEKQEEEMNLKKDEIQEAVYNNDESKINAIASRLLAPCCCTLVVLSLLVGCTSKQATVYIPTDRHIEPCTNSIGIACQAVPNAVFCEFLEKAQELKDLKKEMAVDKRLQK